MRRLLRHLLSPVLASASPLLRSLLGLLLVGVGSGPVYAQGERGAITGVARDSSGGFLPGVTITAANVATNIESVGVTSDAGVYRISALTPGTYRVRAELEGFKTGVLENVVISVAQTATVDFALEVGELTESVTVSAGALLDRGSAEIRRSVSPDEFKKWTVPVSGDGLRLPQDFIFRNLPGAVGGSFQGAINGGQQYSHEIVLEGVSLGRWDLTGGSNNEFTPTADAISEFSVQTGTIGAQYGATQTAVANFALKSGTNRLEGGAYTYYQDRSLTATSALDNFFGRQKPSLNLKNSGWTLGGPLVLPKLYDGHNKTFFFAFSEHTRRRAATASGFQTMPTSAMEAGNFSALLDPAFTGDARSGTQVGVDALGRPVVFGQLYDPQTTRRLADGSVVRDPFPGNRIPPDQWSAVSRFIVDELPHPAPELSRFLDNYPGLGGQPKLDINNVGTKLTHLLADQHKLSGFFNWNRRPRFNSSFSYLPAPGSASSTWQLQEVGGYIVRISEDWTIGNDKFNHVVVGFNRFENPNRSVVANEGWAQQIGLGGVTDSHFPQISFEGEAVQGGRLARLGVALNDFTVNESYIVSDTFTWLRGRHTIQMGGEVRRYRLNSQPQSNTSGTFAFGPAQTGLPGFDRETGFSFASFLAGAVDEASRNVNTTSPGFRQWYVATFIQDDWKPTPRLTVNLGLRWEVPTAITEAHNRMSGLDPTLPNPGANGHPGALVFLEDLGRSSFQEAYYKQVGPRLGLAYGLTEKLVLRGGYSLTFGAPVLNFQTPSIAGFNAGQGLVAGTAPSGVPQDPILSWDAGYPAFDATLPDKDPALLNDEDIQFTPADSTRQPRIHNWNVGLQYELPWKTVLEVAYVGNKGENLWFSNAGRLNQNSPEVLAMGDTLREPLTNQVAKPYPSFTGTVAQALRPFPQYTGVDTLHAKGGHSRYDSLQVTATKRLSEGFSFLAAYTWSKAMTNADSQLDADVMNVYDLDAEYSVASFNVPHFLKLTWVYDLPFGEGRRFMSRGGLLNALLGGWTITGVHNYRSGSPLGISSSIDTDTTMFGGEIRPDIVPGVDPVVDEGGVDFENGTRYLNPDAFAMPPVTSGGVPLRLGTGPRLLENVRGPAQASEDFGLQKRFALPAGFSIDVRVDAFNVFNRVGRGNPETDLTSPDFGLIKEPAYEPRALQLMARVNF